MSSQLYNNVTDYLAAGIGAYDTTISVADGSKFTDPGQGNYTPLYLIRSSDGAHEIVHITAVSGNKLDVTRSMEGTDPLVFNSGDTVQVRPTRQSLLDMDGNVKTSTGDQSIGDALDRRVIYVDTIADLQALDTSALVDRQPISTRISAAGVPGGGGIFHWDSASGASADGWLVVEIPGEPVGRFIRSPDYHLDPMGVGAVGDGAADDAYAIKRWMEASGYLREVQDESRIWLISTPIAPTACFVDFGFSTVRIDHDLVDSDHCIELPKKHVLKNVNIDSSDPLVDRDAIRIGNYTDSAPLWKNVHFENIGGRPLHSSADNFLSIGYLSTKNCCQSPDFDDETNTPARSRGGLRFSASSNIVIDLIRLEGGRSRATAFTGCSGAYIGRVISNYYDSENAGELFYVNSSSDIYVDSLRAKHFTSSHGAQVIRTSRSCTNVRIRDIDANAYGTARAMSLLGLVGGEFYGKFFSENERILDLRDHPPDGVEDPYPLTDITIEGEFSNSSTSVIRPINLDKLYGASVGNININGKLTVFGDQESAADVPGAINTMSGVDGVVNIYLDIDASNATGAYEGVFARAATTNIIGGKINTPGKRPIHARGNETNVKSVVTRGGGDIFAHTSATSVSVKYSDVDGAINIANAVSSVAKFNDAAGAVSAGTTDLNS